MSGLSPKLPVHRNNFDIGGYALTKTHIEVIQQNLKHLVLTNPGERIMDVNFGCGLKRYIFEQNSVSVYTQIAGTIQEQVRRYMPFVSITDIEIRSSTHLWRLRGDFEELPSESIGDVGDNEINIRVLYSVAALRRTAVLSVRI